MFSSPKVADASHECSWLTVSPVPCGGRPLWYGVTWSLLRWVNDHFGPSFPGGERAIQKALVDNDFRGLESIEDVVGVPIETLLAEWAATLVFTNFARDVDVRAASTAYFVLAGNVQSPTAVRVRDQADGQLPPNMQVFLVRIF